MTPIVDLDPLLPSDEERIARRDALVAELGATPSPQAARRQPRRPARRVALVLAVAAGIVLAFVAVPRSGGPDIVASARAAMAAPRDGILHVKVRYEPGQFVSMASYSDARGEMVGRTNGDIERWTAQDPWRERTVIFLDKPGGGVETVQLAFTPTTYSSRNSWEGRTYRPPLTAKKAKQLERSRERGADNLRTLAVGSGQDPVGGIRKLLATGGLRSDGSQDFGDRKALRLVSAKTGQVGGPRFTYEYLIDADTYVPLQVTAVQTIKARPDDPEPAARKDRRIVDRWVFEKFERLPLSAQTEPLLDIVPADPGAAR